MTGTQPSSIRARIRDARSFPRSARGAQGESPRTENSCLVQKLSHYIDLSENDRRLLAVLEETSRDVRRGQQIEGDAGPRDRLYVVSSGWLYSTVDLPDGRRLINAVHQPGDLVGLSEVATDSPVSTLHVCDDATLCPFSREALSTIFAESPRLAALFFAILAREQLVTMDRTRTVARMNARERLAHFLLEMWVRLCIGHLPDHEGTADGQERPSFRLPLTQAEVGDMLGLTNVTVSKTLNAMEDDNLLRRRGDRITLQSEQRLRGLCDFVDRYSTMRTDWFPKAWVLAAE